MYDKRLDDANHLALKWITISKSCLVFLFFDVINEQKISFCSLAYPINYFLMYSTKKSIIDFSVNVIPKTIIDNISLPTEDENNISNIL